MNKERFKSVILVILIGLNVFLTGNILIKMHKADSLASDKEVNIDDIDIDITDYMNPQNFVISFGGNDYSYFYGEPYEARPYSSLDNKGFMIWNVSKRELREYFRGVYEYEFINKEDFTKVREFKSISLELGYKIRANEFISLISGLDEIDRELSEEIDTILIPATDNQKNTLYLAHSKGSKAIKFTGNDRTDSILNVINNLKEVVDENISYKPLDETIGSLNSDILVPLFYTGFHIPTYEVNSLDVESKDTITNIAFNYFENNLSFTKEIIETDGTIVYMYGYGDKVLRINKEGLIEYFVKEPRSIDYSNTDFQNNFKRAIHFIKGRTYFPYGTNNLYLSDYSYDEQTGKHRFAFSYRVYGYQVGMLLGKDDKLIEVEVVNNTVTYYKSIIKTPDSRVVYTDDEIMIFLNVIVNNIKLIKNNYYTSKKIEPESVADDKFPVSDHINEIKLTYYLVGDEFKPAWKIGIDDIVYYFDAYSGYNYTFYKTQDSGGVNELE